jgi:PHD/YefM family antitoxin component YafN of YafNO toxin-antitoxin module
MSWELRLKQFSTAELVRQIGDVTHAASQEPVAITQHKKPRFVMMSVEAYEFMRSKDPRRVYRAEDTPDEIAEWLLPALDKIASGDFDYDE